VPRKSLISSIPHVARTFCSIGCRRRNRIVAVAVVGCVLALAAIYANKGGNVPLAVDEVDTYNDACRVLRRPEQIWEVKDALATVLAPKYHNQSLHSLIPEVRIYLATRNLCEGLQTANNVGIQKIEEFQGVVSSTLNIEVPKWFIQCLHKAEGRDETGVSFRTEVVESAFAAGFDRSTGVFGKRGSLDGFLKEHFAGSLIDSDLLNRICEAVGADCVWLCRQDGESLFLAALDEHGARWFSLVALGKDHAVEWESRIWGLDRSLTRGHGVHCADIVITNDIVAVFGIESTGFYIVARNRETGEAIVCVNSRM
jgi:hypothetical protein